VVAVRVPVFSHAVLDHSSRIREGNALRLVDGLARRGVGTPGYNRSCHKELDTIAIDFAQFRPEVLYDIDGLLQKKIVSDGTEKHRSECGHTS
jgi:hypothetical protein